MSHGTFISSGLLDADTQIYTGRGTLNGVLLTGDGTNDASVIIYDNTSAAGTELFKASVPSSNISQYFDLGKVRCENGIYADVSGTNAEFIVYYGG